MMHHLAVRSPLTLLKFATTMGTMVVMGAIAARPADAQLIPDGTLGAEQSQIIDAGGGVFGIDGGARRDINLFHSFQEFNVENGGGVFFLNPAGVENILTRVTGDNPSNILGVLGVFGGDANLFLMNPNGIVFRPNAQLNLQGSFVATTADGIGFGGQEVFSALTPEVPSPLLTVNPEAFFFNQLNPGAITNNSVAFAGVDPSGAPLFGLRVVDGQDILFLGGDIRFNGGRIAALGGRVELAAVNDIGQVRLTDEGRLQLPRRLQRGDVEFANSAFITVPTADNGGEIDISARTVTLTGGSVLLAGIIEGQGSPESRAGNLTLNASEQVLLQEGSIVGNIVFANSTGTAGNVEIRTAILEMRDGAQLLANTFAEGNAGNVVIRASDSVTFSGTSEDGQLSSGAFSTVNPGGIGEGGDVEIRTAILEVRDGARLSATTIGEGNAGNVLIRASDSVTFSGTSEDGQFRSVAGSAANSGGIGDGGNVEIRTATLEVRDGAGLSASTFGTGNSGSVLIRASDRVTFSGTSEDGRFNSGAFSQVEPGSIGDSGNVEIRTSILEVRDGAQLSSSTAGEGNAGNVLIRAGDRVSFSGTSENGQVLSVATSQVNTGGIGDGGNVDIRTAILEVRDGAQLSASTFAEGNAGNVLIWAGDRVSFSGTSEDGRFNSGAFSQVEPDGIGDGGNVDIRTAILVVLDGTELSASTFGTGNAGSVLIRAGDRVSFRGNTIAASQVNTGGIGDGGNVDIRTPTLEVLDGAQLSASTRGEGNAGNVLIRASDRVTFSGTSENGQFSSTALSSVLDGIGDSGNVEIRTTILEVLDGAQLSASTFGIGNSGSVLIRARDRITFSNNSAALSVVGADGIGDGGDVEIRTTILEVLGGAELSASTLGEGDAGNVLIRAGDRVTFFGTSEDGGFSAAGSTVEVGGIGDGGNVDIRTPTLEVLDRAELLAGTRGEGNAGNVLIRASDRVSFRGNTIAASTVEVGGIGGGGNVDIRTPTLEVLDGAQLAASTRGEGHAGNVLIRASDRVTFSGTSEDGQFRSGAFSTVEADGIGDGGNIDIHTATLEMLDGPVLSARTSGEGNAGNVIIRAGDRINLDDVGANGLSSGILTLTTTNATGQGGAVTITVPELQISNGAVINARTENARRGGNITLDLGQLTLTDGGQVITSTLGASRAGNILVHAERVQISGSDPTLAQRLEEFGSDQVFNESNGESGLFTNTRIDSSGDGGNITLRLNDLEMNDGAILSAQSQGTGTAGQLTVQAQGDVILTDSDLTTSAEQSSGGAIFVSARDIRLFGDSDITTFVQSGEGGGGDITLRGDSIVAFSDSDILAFSVDGSGGNITLDTRAFFGENYRPATGTLTREQIEALDGNDRVDINATGQVRSGDIITPDTSFIQNSLSNLSETVIDTEGLLANSCIARTTQGNTFLITGGGGLPERPGDLPIATYSTGDVRSIPDGQESSDEAWQFGDPIMEPQGVYQLPDGRLVLSRECS